MDGAGMACLVHVTPPSLVRTSQWLDRESPVTGALPIMLVFDEPGVQRVGEMEAEVLSVFVARGRSIHP
jgi:hypothetical protein